MKESTMTNAALLAMVLVASFNTARADTFGSGANQFTIDFVPIGNPGNGNDATGPDYTGDGGLYATPYGGVPYEYRMAVTEAPTDWITKATALGLANVIADAYGASQPAANMTWYEAAAFVNFLNTSTGHQAAYQLTGVTALTPWASGDAWQLGGENLYRHKDAYYFLPSEDEWYKAAYHKNDGVTANYWDYATGSNRSPIAVSSGTAAETVVYNQPFPGQGPAAVKNAGGLSAYGTMGQSGNVWEWNESDSDGINNSASRSRTFRGGEWASPVRTVSSRAHNFGNPVAGDGSIGFRVASVPEPSSTVLILGSGLMFLARRRRAL
jgi:hypothetical protein